MKQYSDTVLEDEPNAGTEGHTFHQEHLHQAQLCTPVTMMYQ